MHTPLFLAEISALLKEKNIKKVIDATFAEGGHGLALGRQGMEVMGIEWDPDMLSLAKTAIRVSGLKNVRVVEGNYRQVADLAEREKFAPVGAVLFDLGLSMYQLDHSAKGFSIRRADKLDLRIGSGLDMDAESWLNKADLAELNDIIGKLVEDKRAFELVQQIDNARRRHRLETVRDLENITRSITPSAQESSKLLRKTLQALRIVVNDEFSNIRLGFEGARQIVAEGGVIIFLTYHSLEDRLVKRLGKMGTEKGGINSLREIGKTRQNKEYPFARSAKLRIYEVRSREN